VANTIYKLAGSIVTGKQYLDKFTFHGVSHDDITVGYDNIIIGYNKYIIVSQFDIAIWPR
jgi:hypothetical protein